MKKIIKIYNETTAQRVLALANWISTIEQRYVEDSQVTRTVAQYQKHPTENIRWFYYDEVFNGMGDIGRQITGYLLGPYEQTGNPVINSEVLEVVEVDLILENYLNK